MGKCHDYFPDIQGQTTFTVRNKRVQVLIIVPELGGQFARSGRYIKVMFHSSDTGLRSQVVSSKLGLTQELSFSRISESATGYTFTPCVGFVFPMA